ncbi:MAG: hypothetical protein M3416_09525 [Acidobacteriota bacterium]|nr:hypothetical protein [Acidobacteriota bacterium]
MSADEPAGLRIFLSSQETVAGRQWRSALIVLALERRSGNPTVGEGVDAAA